jgi:UDP-N-acetylmuramate--alanine ligase
MSLEARRTSILNAADICYTFAVKIFCSGIGGIGLSAYAFHMHARGHEVKGSDREASPVTKALEGAGIGVTTTQDGSGVPDDIDLFVYSEAIPDDAPERRKAKENSVRSLSYFAALGELARGETVIAVCGTHGKSSTTAMIARICIENGLDPSVVVGTKMKELGGLNYRIGRNDLWIVEACEYRSSFLHLSPTTVVMTNVDGDHFDTFDSIEAYHDAFRGFLAKLPQKGSVITHGNDPACATLAKESQRKFIDADTEPLIPLDCIHHAVLLNCIPILIPRDIVDD